MGDNPQAFLQAIPASERDCVVQAFGTENLLELIGTGPPSSEDMATFMGCLSEETARRMMLGMMMMELGISEQDITCMSAGLGDVSFLDLTGPGEQEGTGGQSTQGQTFAFRIFREAFNCLSEEQAAEMFGGMEEGGGPGMAQFKCLFESADDETIAKIFAMGAGPREGAPLPPELLDIITRCGPIPGPSEGSGPPELTPEQQSCVIEAIGETGVQPALHRTEAARSGGAPEDRGMWSGYWAGLGQVLEPDRVRLRFSNRHSASMTAHTRYARSRRGAKWPSQNPRPGSPDGLTPLAGDWGTCPQEPKTL